MLISPYFPKKNPKEVIQFPNKKLRAVCVNVRKIDEEVIKIADDLVKILRKLDHSLRPWLGMAANQLGYDKRVIVIKKTWRRYTVMVNPEIIEKYWPFPILSSCFSFQGLYLVKAFLWVRVRYQNLKGETQEEVLKGGTAAVLQQEIDHINGVLVCD
jgi:peptide deformylase